MTEKSRGNILKEKEIEILAKGLERQHNSHLKMDRSRMAMKQSGPEADHQHGGGTSQLLKDRTGSSDRTGLTTSSMMTSGAMETTSSTMETTSNMNTPGVSGTCITLLLYYSVVRHEDLINNSTSIVVILRPALVYTGHGKACC